MSSKYTKELLENIAKDSFSVMEVVRKLGLKQSGGNHSHVSKKLKEYDLNISHFKGRCWNRGIASATKHTKESFLSSLKKDCILNGTRLKEKLISFGIKSYECELCKNKEWAGKPIPLEVDHINGDHSNNELENLRLLCPNCHAQTDTYCSKNKKQALVDKLAKSADLGSVCSGGSNPLRGKKNLTKTQNYCKCGEKINRRSKQCKKCYERRKKIIWPPKEVILEKLKTKSFLALAKELGVSDNAIRKHLKNMPI